MVVAPLVDMTEELGPTQFLLRSHVPCMSADMVNVSLPLSESDYGRVKDPLMECSDAQVRVPLPSAALNRRSTC